MCFKRNNGMTLIELLVVMVLLSIVSSLLFQGLSVGLSSYERVKKRQSEGQPVMLRVPVEYGAEENECDEKTEPGLLPK